MNSDLEKTFPVGLCGEFRIIIFVFGVIDLHKNLVEVMPFKYTNDNKQTVIEGIRSKGIRFILF
jgi:hypothetical protein